MKPSQFKINRAPVERFARIAQILNAANDPVPMSKLASALEVSIKTVQRDLEFMRDRLALPIESRRGSYGSGGFTFTKPVQLCPVC